MPKFLAASFSIVLLAACVAETDPKIETPMSDYDAALAEELGADDYGMRSYVHVVLMTGPEDKNITDVIERGEIFKGHFSNMAKLAEEGKLALAGPFGDPEKIKRGLYIFNVKTVEEAKVLVQTDPAVAAGIFTAEFTPYYGSAALMKVNDIHPHIQKKKPG